MAKSSMRRFAPVRRYEHSYSGLPKQGRGNVEIFLRAKTRPAVKQFDTLSKLHTYARHYGFSFRTTATRWLMIWPSFEVEFMSAGEIVRFVEGVG